MKPLPHSATPAMLAAAFDTLPHSVALLDPAGTIVAVNDGWIRFGRENGLPHPEALVGTNYFAACNPNDPESGHVAREVAHGIARVIDAASTTPPSASPAPETSADAALKFELEYTCHSPQTHRTMNLRAVGIAGGAVIIHEDVTRQLTASDELTRYREQVAHLARLSTMGQMVSGLAHEINQPLAAIANYAGAGRQLAARNALTPTRLDEVLSNVAAEATRAGEVVQRMLDFSRRRAIRRSAVDLSALLRESARFTGSELRHASVDLRLDLAPNLPAAYADPVLVQQVVVNLIRNAIDAIIAAPVPPAASPAPAGSPAADAPSTAGKPLSRLQPPFTASTSAHPRHGQTLAHHAGRCIILTARRAPQNPGPAAKPAPADALAPPPSAKFVEISVLDNGVGVPPHILSRLFDPFFTTKSNGLGMGLNLSRTIIEDHGGRLLASPNPPPAPGMTFSFTLPVAE